MVTTFFPPYHFGGEAMFLYHLTNELARRGHEVTVVHCVDSFEVLTKDRPRGDFPHSPGVTVEPLRNVLGPASPLVTYLAGTPGLKAPELRRVFGRSRFDVVHFHLVTLVGGPGVLRYGDGVKLYTTHDHWLVCPMYDLWRYNREVCERPTCIRCSLSFKRPPQLWRYTNWRRHLDNVDLFLSPSRSAIEQHRRRGFTHPMRHLPYFLPAQESIDTNGVPAQRDVRASVLPLRRQAREAQRSPDAHRRVPGLPRSRPVDRRRRRLRRRATHVAQSGLDHVRFLGRVHPAELRELYAGAVAVLVPSLVYETFGLTALEGFAQRTPVIVRDHGAPPEVVADSGGGFTYRTQEELVEAMERLRTDPALRAELGNRGYEAWRRLWSEDAHVEGYFAAIDDARAARR